MRIVIYREIYISKDYIQIYLGDNEKVLSIGDIIRKIAKVYNIDHRQLLDNECVREFCSKYSENVERTLNIIIDKDSKTADELKREIKRVTKDLERLVQTLIDTARELREQQDLTDWVWERARYDTEKRRFVKCAFLR